MFGLDVPEGPFQPYDPIILGLFRVTLCWGLTRLDVFHEHSRRCVKRTPRQTWICQQFPLVPAKTKHGGVPTQQPLTAGCCCLCCDLVLRSPLKVAHFQCRWCIIYRSACLIWWNPFPFSIKIISSNCCPFLLDKHVRIAFLKSPSTSFMWRPRITWVFHFINDREGTLLLRAIILRMIISWLPFARSSNTVPRWYPITASFYEHQREKFWNERSLF